MKVIENGSIWLGSGRESVYLTPRGGVYRLQTLPDPNAPRRIPQIHIFRKIEKSQIQEPFRGTALIGNPYYGHKMDTAT